MAGPGPTLLSLREINRGKRAITVGIDRADEVNNFVKTALWLKVTPHVSQTKRDRGSSVDVRTTRHEGSGRVGASGGW